MLLRVSPPQLSARPLSLGGCCPCLVCINRIVFPEHEEPAQLITRQRSDGAGCPLAPHPTLCQQDTWKCLPGRDTIPPFVPPATSEAPPAAQQASWVPALHPCATASWSPSTLQQMNCHTGQGNGEPKQHRPYSTLSAYITQKSCVNCMLQLVLTSPLHLPCGHV